MGLEITGQYRYPPPRSEWLALQDEPVLDPDLAVVDSHHHFWEEAGHAYLLNQFADELNSGHCIVASVFVQAGYAYRTHGPEQLRCVGETEAVLRLRGEAQRRGLSTDVAAAIVGFADLSRGNRAAEVIEAHLTAAPDCFRGIRHSVARDSHFPNGIVLRPAPADLLLQSAYRAGLALLPRYGLSYDAMLYHQQIPELVATAQALPDLHIVLDHYGCIIGVGPYEGRAAESFAHWRRDLSRLARCANVRIKLGGLGMIICGARWHERARPPDSSELAEAWRPYFETCLDLFGAERCMLEGNFPVDKAMYSYRACWNAFKLLTRKASVSERAALFSNTAARTYGIRLHASPKRAVLHG